MRAADVDERAARRAADLEDVGLDVLADAVVLGRRLVGGAQDGLGLAEVEDDARRAPRGSTAAGDDLALAMRELVEDRLALRLTQALADDLAGDLGADAPEMRRLELLRTRRGHRAWPSGRAPGPRSMYHCVVSSSTSATT